MVLLDVQLASFHKEFLHELIQVDFLAIIIVPDSSLLLEHVPTNLLVHPLVKPILIENRLSI